MKTDIQRLISNPFLLLVLATSALSRVLFQVFFLSSDVSFLGPDEGTYAALTKYAATGSPVQDFPVYGPGLYNSARSFILPSILLTKLGLNELHAVRATASIFGFMSLFFLILCYIAVSRSKNLNQSEEPIFRISMGQKFAFLIFAFLPSNFLWSNLGLRESSSALLLIIVTYFTIKFFDQSRLSSFIYLFSAIVSLVLSFGARRETAIVFSAIALSYSVFLPWNSKKILIITATAVSFILGHAYTSTPVVEPIRSVSAINVDTKVQSMKLADSCKFNGEIIKVKQSSYVCRFDVVKSDTKRILPGSIVNPIAVTKMLDEKRNANRVDADSALPPSRCNQDYSSIAMITYCNARELPYRLGTFLLRPFPLIDSGSNSLQLASVENPIWYFLLLTSIYLLITRQQNRRYRYIILWLYSYSLIIAAAASLYEGNLGTAFRHKSSILWPLILGLLLLLNSTKRKVGLKSN